MLEYVYLRFWCALGTGAAHGSLTLSFVELLLSRYKGDSVDVFRLSAWDSASFSILLLFVVVVLLELFTRDSEN